MLSDIMNTCADMILADAIEDMANEEDISIGAARDRILNSDAYECLYDFNTNLWMEGPDYFRNFCKTIENIEAFEKETGQL